MNPRVLRTICGLALLSFLILPGCQSSEPPVAKLPAAPVSVSQPISREIVNYDTYEGRIATPETVDVRARVRGEIIKISFQDGQHVNAGQLLFELDPRPYQASLAAAEAQKSSAAAALKLAKANYDRAVKLVPIGAESREKLDIYIAEQSTAVADMQKADANIQQAKLDLGYTKISAPIAGRISRPMQTMGNLVNGAPSDPPLTSIVSMNPMYVYFNVDERSLLRYLRSDLDHLKDRKQPKDYSLKEQKIPMYVGLEGEDGYPRQGMLDYADNRINPSTGTISIRGVLDNANGLLTDGMRARVRVPVTDPYKALLITERAIATDQDNKYVFVVSSEKLALRRDVTLDRTYEGLQIIKSGLNAEDWIIVNGIQRVRDGAEVLPHRVPMPGAASLEAAKASDKPGTVPAEPAKAKDKAGAGPAEPAKAKDKAQK